ncbi:hypothetical protein HELRODRAFT_173304 [Helobdella robusta]|uniref:IF rod domain-containing protein n=1 Tax=Helobdella robusta TaxID=6412 RepID=T1F6N5_HELRO|nr:hypothetical protein HELRODRAFT_173304 [Helobdella robusta]ESO03612.1 hypothetical protein HELRODRAFT_173304 [Helobdella robusta]
MSRQYSTTSTTTTSSSSDSQSPNRIGGSVDPPIVATNVDLYASRPKSSVGPPLFGIENLEPLLHGNVTAVVPQPNVRPIIAGRSVIINRSVADPFNRGSRAYHSEKMYRVVNLGSMQPGTYAAVATTGVGAVMESRDKEKRDMQDLNERLANYLEKVRFLEAQNRNLCIELERLKQKWGQETSQIKSMYQIELDEARRLLDEAVKGKGKLEIKVASLEEYIEELRQKLEESNSVALQWKEKWEGSIQRVSDAEAEVSAIRRRMEGMEVEKERDKKALAKLQELLANVRQDLDNESYSHLEAASRLQSLEEELAFVKAVHEQEMKEMAALVNRDTTSDNRAFWKNEMGAALKEIQEMYEEKLDTLRSDMESSYNFKVQEFRTGATKNNMEVVHSKEENKRLKTTLVELRDRLSLLEGQNLGLQRELESLKRDGEVRERDLERENTLLKTDIAKLRAEMDAIMMELQHIMDTKLGLEMEIAAYRKLLEGEEHRLVELEAHLNKATKATPAPPQVAPKPYKESSSSSTTTTTTINRSGSSFSSNSSSSGASSSSGGGSSSSSGYGGSFYKNEQSSKAAARSGQPKYSYQRNSKGPCGIADAAMNGTFVVLENTGRKEENIGQWTVKRILSDVESLEYVLQPNVFIKPNTTIRQSTSLITLYKWVLIENIWSLGSKPSTALYSDIESELTSWGVADNVVTKLIAPNGEMTFLLAPCVKSEEKAQASPCCCESDKKIHFVDEIFSNFQKFFARKKIRCSTFLKVFTGVSQNI